MKNLKTNWLVKHAITVFSCVLIIALGIAFISRAVSVTTTIGENIATNDLSVAGNVTSGTWQGTAIGAQYGGTGADFSGSTGLVKLTGGTASMITDSSANWDTAYAYSQIMHLPLAGGTLTGGLTVDGVTGLVDSDIPDAITASNYLPLTGGTLSADLILQETGDAKITIHSNTDTPTANSKLLVVQKGTTPTELFSVDEDGDAAVANDLAISGNVGIGTTTPNSKLTIKGSGNNIFNLQDSNGAEKVTVLNNGNVGIGTTSPNRLLELSGSGAEVTNLRLTNRSWTSGAVNTLEFHSDPDGYNKPTAAIKAMLPSNMDFAAELQFWTLDTVPDALLQRMTISKTGNVGIGTAAPSTTALLDVSSTTKGFLPPRMTAIQRDAISSPSAGLMIYNTDTNKLNFYNSTAWEQVTSGL